MNMKHLYTELAPLISGGSVTDDSISDNSVIEIYFDNTDVYIKTISQNEHTVSFTTEGNTEGVNVCVVVNNLTNFKPYDDTEINNRIESIESDIDTITTELETIGTELDERVPSETLLGGVLYHSNTGNTWRKLNANNLSYDDESTIYSAMGDIDELQTTNKNLVGAINEVKESGGGSSQEIYDYTERVIGTWFDKPLYRKYVNVGAQNIVVDNWSGTLCTDLNIKFIKSIKLYHSPTGSNPAEIHVEITQVLNGGFRYYKMRDNVYGGFKINSVLIEYTKVGD